MFCKHYSKDQLIWCVKSTIDRLTKFVYTIISTAYLVASSIYFLCFVIWKLILLKLQGNNQGTINVTSKIIFSCCIMKYSRPINFACNVTNDVYLILSVFGIYRVLKRRQKHFNVSLPVVPFSCLLVFSMQIVSKCCF